jgi:hypothetical protein
MHLETLHHNLTALLTTSEESFALVTGDDFLRKHPEAARVLVTYLHRTIAEGESILREVATKLERDKHSEDAIF